MSDKRTSRDLAATLRQRGISVAELARALDRSERMVRKVLSGDAPGHPYRQTLAELVDHSRASTVPSRRRGADGHIVPVRASKKGASSDAPVSRVPRDTGGNYVDVPSRTTFSTTTTHFDDGTRLHDVTMPRTTAAKGRETAKDAVMDILRSAAKGQRHVDKRAKVRLTYESGRTVELGKKGGYDVSRLLEESKKAGKDPMSYLASQVGNSRYPNFSPDESRITGVSIVVYDNPR